MLRATLIAALLASVAPTPARAEGQLWTAVFLQARQSADAGALGWLDLHARRRGDGTLFIVRPAVGYAFGKVIAAHVGYASVALDADEGDTTVEHRAWQQAVWTPDVSDTVKVQIRPRFEQRFRAGDPDIGYRARLLLRAQVAPTTRPFQLVVTDEVFYALNDTAGPAGGSGLSSGFDQNRAFLGLGVDTALKGVRVEAGYLNVVLRRDGAAIDHAFTVNLIATFVGS